MPEGVDSWIAVDVRVEKLAKSVSVVRRFRARYFECVFGW